MGIITIFSQSKGQQNFPIEEHVVNTLGFANYTVSVTTTQLGYYRMKAVINNKKTNRPGCVSLRFTKTAEGQI